MSHRERLQLAFRVRTRIQAPRPSLPAWCRHLAQQGLDHADIAEVLGLDRAEVAGLLARPEGET